MSDRESTLYINQFNRDKMHRLAARLERLGVLGLRKSNGSYNYSAVFRAFMASTENYLKIKENERK